jgi:hypothetical protein
MSCPIWESKTTAGRPVRYRSVTLSRDGKKKTFTVNIVVCLAFHGPRPPNAHAAHRDGNSLNDNAGNLRWATATENAADKLKHGTHLCGERAPMSKLTEPDVLAIIADTDTFEEIAAKYPVGMVMISRIKNRQSWKHLTENRPIANSRPPRQPLGEKHANSKLAAEDVRSIRSDTRHQAEIADEFGISQSNVSLIKRGVRWKHI